MGPMAILGIVQAAQALLSKDKKKEGSKASKIAQVAGAISSLYGGGGGEAAAGAAGGAKDALPMSGAQEAGSNLRGPMMPSPQSRMFAAKPNPGNYSGPVQTPSPQALQAPPRPLAPPTGPAAPPRMSMTPRPAAPSPGPALRPVQPWQPSMPPESPSLPGYGEAEPTPQKFSPTGSAAIGDSMALSPAEKVELAKKAGQMADETAGTLLGTSEQFGGKLQQPARMPLVGGAAAGATHSPGVFQQRGISSNPKGFQPQQMGGPAMNTPSTPQADRASNIQKFIDLLEKQRAAGKWQQGGY